MKKILDTQLKFLDPNNQIQTCNLKYKDKILWDILIISLISYNLIAYYLYHNFNKYIGLFFIIVSIFSSLSDSNLVNNYIIDYIDRITATLGFILYMSFIYYNLNIQNIVPTSILLIISLYNLNEARKCDVLNDWKFYQNFWHIIPVIHIILLEIQKYKT